MVIRGGMGVFYDRFGERATLLANRFNGTNQLDFRVFDPQRLDEAVFSLNGVTNVPTIESLSAFAAPQHSFQLTQRAFHVGYKKDSEHTNHRVEAFVCETQRRHIA